MRCQNCCSELPCQPLIKIFLKRLNKVLFNFFFYGKVKIRSNVSHWLVIIVMADLECPIWNLQSKFKESCVKKFIENYQSPWKSILSHHLKNHGDKFLLHCNYDVADLPKSLPKFYRECFEAWATITEKQPSSREHVMQQILWNN